MKIVTWNCNMAFRKKYKRIVAAFDPDIMVIQECEEPNKLNKIIDSYYEIFWIGDNKNKGLSIIINDRLQAKELAVDSGSVRYMLPIVLDNYFKIIAFWAMNDQKDYKQRYIGQVWTGLNKAQGQIDDKTVIIGDFNWNIIWDHSISRSLSGKLMDVINFLKTYQIESSYHHLKNEKFGEESEKTFYLYRKLDKAYHTDYIFLPVDILKDIKQFAIGKYEDWIEYSDHMPLFIEF